MYLLSVWLVVGILASPVRADIDPTEYEVKASVGSDRERQRLEAGFARNRQQDAAEQKLEEDRAAQKLMAEKAAWDALPFPLRLTRTRCTVCHLAEHYLNQRHNRVGWELVVLRMQYLNQAVLQPGERATISAYLTQASLVTGLDAWLEGLQQLAGLPLPLRCWRAWKLWCARSGTTITWPVWAVRLLLHP